MTDDLAWRVEAACLAAWPAPETVAVDGWLLRYSGGPTRRTNSVNPSEGSRAPVAAVMPTIDAFYSRRDRPIVIRVPTLAPGLDADLDALGFAAPEGETRTLHSPRLVGHTDPAVRLTTTPTAAWLDARVSMTNATQTACEVFVDMTRRIASPTRFASIEIDGMVVAIAYGVIHNSLLVMESVATAPPARRHGHARAIVARLLAWAKEQGARGACLQVVADNAGAIALYGSLGFTEDLYRYHYRAAPGR